MTVTPPSACKMLYLNKHTRQDIQMAVALLFTRVKKPNIDDYKKLMLVMQCIRNLKKLTLTNQQPKVVGK